MLTPFLFSLTFSMPNPWNLKPSAIALGDAWKVPTAYPDQPFLWSGPLRKSWRLGGVVALCLPELNSLALAKCVVCEMRIVAVKEMVDKTVVEQPTLESVLEYTGHFIASTPESTQSEDATIYESTVEGSMQITKYAASASGDAASRASVCSTPDGVGGP